jgi:gliding motility-associated-like protein
VVNYLPSVRITSIGDAMCEYENRTLKGFPPGGMFNIISGPGLISSDLLSVSDTGTIDLLYSYTDVCTALAYQSIRVNTLPSVNAGSSQDLKVVFETHFNAELTQGQTGEWSVVSGNGQIADMNSPVSAVTGLLVGENVFLWTVHEGNCISSAEVTIKVSDLFLPSVITPNGDGKNDLFKVNGPEGKMELVIFSRWGNVEYDNHDYQNTWDGRNNRGAVMPYDTYMYIMKFSSGLTRKGTVLIVR